MSITGSYAESVYFEAPYEVPGPCKTFCLRCPLPSLIATIYFTVAVAGFCGTAIKAFFLTEELFQSPLEIAASISTWRFLMMMIVIIFGALNLIIAVIMISCSCLGTGATRKEFICRFKSRAKGRCQTWVVMLIVFLLLLIWIGLALFMILPLEFFSIQNKGQCQSCKEIECTGEIDLRQWALAPWDQTPSFKNTIAYDELFKLCESSVMWWYCAALGLNLIIIMSLIHFLINFSANFAKLRDRFKAGYIDRRTGTYLTRSDNLRGSRASMNGRASLRSRQARSKRNGAVTKNVNGSTLTTLPSETYRNDGLEASQDDVPLSTMERFYRSTEHEDDPPSYSAQNLHPYEQHIKRQDEMDYGESRSYRRGDEPTTNYYDQQQAMEGGSRGGDMYKIDLDGYDDEDVPQEDDRYAMNERTSTFGAPYQDDIPPQEQRDSYHSDPSTLQSQISHFRARQEYFI